MCLIFFFVIIVSFCNSVCNFYVVPSFVDLMLLQYVYNQLSKIIPVEILSPFARNFDKFPSVSSFFHACFADSC